MAAKILLVDDEESIHVTVSSFLTRAGYTFLGAHDSEEGLEMIASCDPDLLLLDVMLPGMNGFDFCSAVRERGFQLPIVFLSAKSDIVDKSVGFRAGADDYVSKPFDVAELLLRIEAHLRRYRGVDEREPRNDARASAGGIEVFPAERQVRVDGKPVRLTAKEFEIVSLLASHPGRVYTRAEIQEHLWGKNEGELVTNSITVFVRKIREKIEENPSDPKRLLTVPCVGYKIAGDRDV